MNLTEQQQKVLANIVDFVTDAHHGQYRKGNGLPFVVHPFSVLKIICGWGINDYVIFKVALTHDVLEDCKDISFNQLEEVIGQDAAFIVEELTFRPNKLRLVSVSQQKQEYIGKIGNKSLQALIVKLADRIDNTRDFYLEDKSYAQVYWRKATELFNAFFSRKSEVIEVFGKEVFNAIKTSLILTFPFYEEGENHE